MKSIFLQKSYAKRGGEASPRPFYKKSKLSMALDQQTEMLTRLVLIIRLNRGLPKYIKIKVLTHVLSYIKLF